LKEENKSPFWRKEKSLLQNKQSKKRKKKKNKIALKIEW
jgi:hypothetical protein